MAQDAEDKRNKRSEEKRHKRSWEMRAQVAIDWVRATSAAATGRSGLEFERARAEVERQLRLAESYLDRRASPWTWWRGTRIEGTWANVHAATVSLIQVLDDEQLVGISPKLLTVIERDLSPTCRERRAIRPWVHILESQNRPLESQEKPPASQDKPPESQDKPPESQNPPPESQNPPRRTNPRSPQPAPGTIPANTRDALAAALSGAQQLAAANYHRLRRFQGTIIGGAFVLLTLVATLTMIGWREPDVIPLCFPDPDAQTEPTTPVTEADAATADENVEVGAVVCPSSDSLTPATVDESRSVPDASERASSADVATVVLFGLIGAALTSVSFVIRRAPPTSVPCQASACSKPCSRPQPAC